MINSLVWFTITNNELNLLRSLQSFYYFSVVMLLWRHKFKRIIRCCVKMSSRYTETVSYLSLLLLMHAVPGSSNLSWD